MKTIVFSGPESSGKTHSCAQIAAAYGCPMVQEYARTYLNGTGGVYGPEDLSRIAEEQLRLQLNARHSSQAFLFCDTDLLTLLVWQEWVYGSFDEELHQQYVANLPDHYFLCAPDLPWTPDPLRENPDEEERWKIFERHEELITEQRVPFTTLKGTGSERLRSVFQFLDRSG